MVDSKISIIIHTHAHTDSDSAAWPQEAGSPDRKWVSP